MGEPISRAGRVVFVDAAAEGGAGDGQLLCAGRGRPTACATAERVASDDARRAVGDGRELFGRRPPATMVIIAGGAFEVSEALTPAVAVAGAGGRQNVSWLWEAAMTPEAEQRRKANKRYVLVVVALLIVGPSIGAGLWLVHSVLVDGSVPQARVAFENVAR